MYILSHRKLFSRRGRERERVREREREEERQEERANETKLSGEYRYIDKIK